MPAMGQALRPWLSVLQTADASPKTKRECEENRLQYTRIGRCVEISIRQQGAILLSEQIGRPV